LIKKLFVVFICKLYSVLKLCVVVVVELIVCEPFQFGIHNERQCSNHINHIYSHEFTHSYDIIYPMSSNNNFIRAIQLFSS
jgi:hypothetical protein